MLSTTTLILIAVLLTVCLLLIAGLAIFLLLLQKRTYQQTLSNLTEQLNSCQNLLASKGPLEFQALQATSYQNLMGTPNPDEYENLLSDTPGNDAEMKSIYETYQQTEGGIDFDRIEQSILTADGAEWDFGRD